MIGRLLAKHRGRFAASERFRPPPPAVSVEQHAHEAIAVVAEPTISADMPCVDPGCLICKEAADSQEDLLRVVNAEVARLKARRA